MKKFGRFTFQTRTQFSFRAHDRHLHRLLNAIADSKINIAAYCQTKENKVNSVNMVVGTSESGSLKDNLAVRNILRSIGVPFHVRRVIQIVHIAPGIPGVIRSVFRALFRKVKVRALYDGENNCSILDVTNIGLAAQILKKL